jgi:hypothetical protein
MSLRISFLFTALLAFLFAACSPEHSKIVIAEFDSEKLQWKSLKKLILKMLVD